MIRKLAYFKKLSFINNKAFSDLKFVEVDEAFAGEVEDEVDDGEVGEKAVFVGEDLVVGWQLGGGLGRRSADEIGGSLYLRVDVDELAAEVDEGFVHVHEVGPPALEERTEVVLKVFEEGGVEVGGLDGVPVLMLPVGAVADTHVAHQAFGSCGEVGFVNGYGELEWSVGRVDGATVADGLLVEVLVLLKKNWFAQVKLSEPRYRGEI